MVPPAITAPLLPPRPWQLPWRPFWDLLLRLHLLPRRSEFALPAQNVSVLADFVSSASRHFEPGAAAAVAALLTPSLSNVQSTAYFTAQARTRRCAFLLLDAVKHRPCPLPPLQACLLLLLPSTTRLEDLPPGTAASWLRTWSLVDDCKASDLIWGAIFARLAHPARIGSCPAAVEGAPGAPISWPAMLPLLFTRLQSALTIPVAGQTPRQVRAGPRGGKSV